MIRGSWIRDEGEAGDLFIPRKQDVFGRNGKYTGTRLCSNGSNLWDMIPCSNGINMQVNLRIQSGTDGNWENSLNNIHCGNIPNKTDHLDYRVHVNGCVRYDFPMTINTKTRVSYANVV